MQSKREIAKVSNYPVANHTRRVFIEAGAREVDRMRYAMCSRHDEPEHNPLPDVTYYVLCVIEQPKSAAAVAIEVAFGQRDQVEYWDLSR